MQAFASLGQWWSRARPDHRLVGHFSFDAASSAQVTIVGNLDDGDTSPPFGVLHSPPSGWGSCLSSITAVRTRTAFGAAGRTETYELGRPFLGGLHIDNDTALFGYLEATLPPLDAWWNAGGLEFDIDQKIVRFRDVTMAETEHDTARVQIRSTPTGTMARHRVELVSEAVAEIVPSAPRTVRELSELLREVTYFVAFVCGTSGAPGRVRLRASSSADESRSVRQLLSDPSGVSSVPESHRVRPILPPPPALDLGRALGAWLPFVRKHWPFFVALLGPRPRFIEPQLLLLNEAIRLYPGRASERDAVRELIDGAPSVLDDIVPNRDGFARRVRLLREHLFTEERVDAREAREIMQQLQWAIRLSLLRDLGIDPILVRSTLEFRLAPKASA